MRQLRGLKQSHVAELFGVSQATISRWETGTLALSEDARAAMARLIAPYPSADRALKRLVEAASIPVHLVCDATHILLAASPARTVSWRGSASSFIGRSLWRYASPAIQTMEARLPELGWQDVATPALAFWTGRNNDQEVPIAPGLILWERIRLEGGREARLVSTVPDLPPHAKLVDPAA